MKKKYWVFGLMLSTLVMFNSCEEDEEIEDQIANAIPNDDGPEGDARDKFVGDWTVTENSTVHGERNFIVNISKDDQFPSQVNMSNFYLIGKSDTVVATVSSIAVKTITIQVQTVKDVQYGGDGEMENDKRIKLNYIVEDGNAVKDTVTATLIK